VQDFEKLGAFYLGRLYDPENKKRLEGLLLYDSRDLVTHAVTVGMTGSGKTGLCVALIEEAAIDGIPAILIDPKGDLANLLLTFPDLCAEDFLPWIDPEEARGKGISPEEYAARQAEAWRKGLADWGQAGQRIRRLKESAEFTIYTPASTAGVPVSILGSFAPPPAEVAEDRELLRERVSAAATGLLGLLGTEADPVRSREHILLSTILDNAWKQGRAPDLGGIVHEIQNPPVSQVGALPLESFYPAKERFELGAALNNVLAAPGFEAWLEGEPLDIGRMLYTAQGKPRVSIFSIAHLDDRQRMFFVSLLLNEVLGWMRAQSGTGSLRAILYMDEIFGYFPPVANPPSKMPLLTLLKQARAFGLGVVLATQNPVDLDYKGLANAGTWFIGRLQTERDKARVLDGLEGAAATAGVRFERREMDRILSGLGSRVFLMNNVHEDAPAVFQSRWTLSYLRGPLSRAQTRMLSRSGPGSAAREAERPPVPSRKEEAASRPALPPGVPQQFLPLRKPAPAGAELVYRPMLLGAAETHFLDLKAGVDATRETVFLTPLSTEAVAANWNEAVETDLTAPDLEAAPAAEARYAHVPSAAANPRSYAAWTRDFAGWLSRTHKLALLRSASTQSVSRPGESERDFRVRLQQAGRERRDAFVEDLRRKYAPRNAALEERIRRARQAAERESGQAQQQKLNAAISVGATLLGALLGRKTLSSSTLGRAAGAARAASRAGKEAQDVERASVTVASLERQLADLEWQFEAELAQAQARLDPATEALETVEIRPKKANIQVRIVALAWAPYWEAPRGQATPAW
jgi:hypothetical protein